MGWLTKGLALVAGLVALSVGFWPLWVTCFGYLGYSLWSATRKRTVVLKDEKKSGRAPRVRRVFFRKRYILSGFFCLLALVAFGAHGTLAPWVFLSLAGAVTASGFVKGGPGIAQVDAVPYSIMLRSRWLPVSWTALAEVKFGTPQVSKALSSAGSEVIMVTSSERVSVYIPVRVRSFSASGAERKASQKMGPLARRLSARGAYLLPLDSKDAAVRMGWSLKEVGLAIEHGRDGLASLNSTHFDVLVLAPAGNTLESAAAYVAEPATGAHSYIPATGRELESQPLVWEVLEALGERRLPQVPDDYTNFLSSVYATRGEGLGERLVNGGETGDGTVLIGSLGAAHVELSRPQLRAIVKAYG